MHQIIEEQTELPGSPAVGVLRVRQKCPPQGFRETFDSQMTVQLTSNTLSPPNLQNNTNFTHLHTKTHTSNVCIAHKTPEYA